jgi:hypothetical protein
MPAKSLGLFVAGLAVGAGLMWLMGPQGGAVAVAPESNPALAEADAPKVGGQPVVQGEPAPLPKPAPVASNGTESEAEGEARKAAAALDSGRPSEIAPGKEQPRDGTPGVNVVPEAAPGSSTVVLGDGKGSFTFKMFRTPEQVYGTELVETARNGDVSSEAFQKVFEQLLGDIGSEDGEKAHAARQLLDSLIAKGRLSDQQLAVIEAKFDAAETGSTERGQFAAMLARAKASTPEVANFLDRLDRAGDYEAARAALHAFEHPNTLDPAVHTWRRKVIGQSPENALLSDALDPHRMSAWVNRQNAPLYVGVLRDRLHAGGLKSETRGRALRSIATAGIHAPELAAAALATAAATDADPKLAAYAKDAAALVRAGAANPSSLQKAWYQQYPPSEHVVSGGTIILEGGVVRGEGEGDASKDDGEKK